MKNDFSVGKVVEFSGVVDASLRTMKAVEEGTRLQVGQTFPSSKIIMIRCAEEANLRGIYLTNTIKSDKFTYKTEGLQFHVHASNSEVVGWKITSCNTGVGTAGVHVMTPAGAALKRVLVPVPHTEPNGWFR